MSIDKKTNGKSNEKVNERNAQKKSATAGGEKYRRQQREK